MRLIYANQLERISSLKLVNQVRIASIVNNQVPFLHQLTLLMVIVSNIQYFILTVFENYRKSPIQHCELCQKRHLEEF